MENKCTNLREKLNKGANMGDGSSLEDVLDSDGHDRDSVGGRRRRQQDRKVIYSELVVERRGSRQ